MTEQVKNLETKVKQLRSRVKFWVNLEEQQYLRAEKAEAENAALVEALKEIAEQGAGMGGASSSDAAREALANHGKLKEIDDGSVGNF